MEFYTSIALSGTEFLLDDTNTTGLSAVIGQIQGDCTFTIDYDGTEYEGTIEVVGTSVLLVFENVIALPSGMCVVVECAEDTTPENERDCKDVELIITADMRLAILDDNGCLKGWVSLEDLCNWCTSQIDIPTNLCELYDVNTIPEGNLVAADKILTTQGCDIKAVDPDDIIC